MQGSQVKQIHDLCQKIMSLKKANNYPVRIRLRGLVQKCSCKPREVLFCDAALAQPPVTCMPRWRAFCPITQPPRIFQTTCLHTYILRNGNVITIEMGDSEVATEKLLYHISRLGRTNYSHWLLATINHLILSCRPRWQLP